MEETSSNFKGSNSIPVWKNYLYQLQLQAPHPKPIICQRKNVVNRPTYYGLEHHGMISRQESEQLLGIEDGHFLVRESSNPPGSCTLAILFNNEIKNYKVYYDGAFYVGEKRFDTIIDLVHDGLISFYIEKHASNYIAMMCEENNYSESPYVMSKAALLASQKIQPASSSNPQSIHSSFQKQNVQHQSSNMQHQQQINNFHQSQLIHQTLSETSKQNAYNGIQLDKENRHFSSQLIDSQNKLGNLNSSIKSNAILDRFDIMNSEKPHSFKANNFKGPHWCDFCLNFMWGLVSQGVKCQDCGFQAHKKCSERAPPDCEPQMKFIKKFFGVDLTTLVKATNSIRPVIVEKCIEEIEKRKGAIESEGIYRVSGFSDAIEDLKLAFDRGDNVDFNEFKYNDIHIICSLLKLYLRQLPIPLITFDVYNKLIDSFNLSNPKYNLVESIKLCISELPPAHYLTLKYLMGHLHKVADYSTKNQMSYENLAIVFGPTLMRSINPDPVLALKNTHKEQKITELLISNYCSIFEK